MNCKTAKVYNKRLLKQIRNQHFLLCFMFMLFLFMLNIFGCGPSGGSHQYSSQAHDLINSIHLLLISEKLCNDKNDCNKKEYALWRSGKGVYVYVYGITDKTIAKKIAGLCIDAHVKNPGIQYEFTMYAQTKNETIKGKSKTAILQLILNKEE